MSKVESSRGWSNLARKKVGSTRVVASCELYEKKRFTL
jgi:hypothetical protein